MKHLPENPGVKVYPNSWKTNEELVRYIMTKPNATDDEKLLAERLERKL